jgi:para-nitrobenzyl esterase
MLWLKVLALCGAFAGMISSALADPLTVEGGAIKGTTSSDGAVHIYKGIPYAAPPVGDFRWRAPQPLQPWHGVAQTAAFKPICMQPDPLGGNSLFTTLFFTPIRPMSEDCLYLNVWTTAAPGANAPVMVWIPGGGFRGGSASDPFYDGEALARRGVVFVSINYRLFRFGFLAHPALTAESKDHASGNYGLMDQIAALKWVSRNISQFGGDPRKVTIFGQSAGAYSVSYLIVSPLAKGLFQRAISESGGGFTPNRVGSLLGHSLPSLSTAEKVGAKLGKELGAPTIEALRRVPADKLMAAPLSDRYDGSLPILDGYVLPDTVQNIFARGTENDVPTIAGSNANEGSLFPSLHSLSAFRAFAQSQFGEDAAAFLKLYPAHDDKTATIASQTATRETLAAWSTWKWARVQGATGKAPIYYYYFARKPPAPANERFAEGLGANAGVYHGAEIAYVFGHFYPANWTWSADDRGYSQKIQGYWINFVKTGNPNGQNLPTWPAFDPKDPKVMTFGPKTIALGPVVNKPYYDFWDRYDQKWEAK